MAQEIKPFYGKVVKVHQNHSMHSNCYPKILTYALEAELVGLRFKSSASDLMTDRPVSDEALDFYYFCEVVELNWFEKLWFDLGTVVAFLMQREYYD